MNDDYSTSRWDRFPEPRHYVPSRRERAMQSMYYDEDFTDESGVENVENHEPTEAKSV